MTHIRDAMLAAMAITSFGVAATPMLHCSPKQKLVCEGGSGCQPAELGYQNAERYAVNAAARTVSACLWTTCYSGDVAVAKTEFGTRMTGQLRGEGPAGHQRLPVDFLLADDHRFSVTHWTGPQSNAISFGQCGPEPMATGPRLEVLVEHPPGGTDNPEGPSACSAQKKRADLAPQLTLTDQDLQGWMPATGTLALSPEQAGKPLYPQLAGACFHLFVAGRYLTHGILLPHDSPWLTGLPTFNLRERDGRLTLQLTTGNHFERMRLMHVDALTAALGR